MIRAAGGSILGGAKLDVLGENIQMRRIRDRLDVLGENIQMHARAMAVA